MIEEPLAAALGAGLDISQPGGTMVVDIGGGTTDVAVGIANAYPNGRSAIEMHVRGRDLIDGLPKEITVNSQHIYEAIKENLALVVNSVKEVFEQTPPELAADIVDKGIVLTGGGTLLKDIDTLLSVEMGLNVFVVEDSLSCVALGTGRALPMLNALNAQHKRQLIRKAVRQKIYAG